nr:unnamed protein product [Digitaria exilis]
MLIKGTRRSRCNGNHTSFWLDSWLLNSPIAEIFPALYSHCVEPEITVADAWARTVATLLRPRLTRVAAEELAIIQSCLSIVSFSDNDDARYLSSQQCRPFDTRDVPRALQAELPSHPEAMRVWQTKLPTKVKFFGWLLTHGRVNCRAYQHRRNICTREEAFCETCSDVLETADHIFFQCPIALRFWRLVGFHHTTQASQTTGSSAENYSYHLKCNMMQSSYFSGTSGRQGMQKSLTTYSSPKKQFSGACSATWTFGAQDSKTLKTSGGFGDTTSLLASNL